MDDGRRKLLSQLEGVFHDHTKNNDRPIRYPITFDGNSRLKGKNTILNVTPENKDIFYSGRYKFGANDLYVYQALDALLNRLSAMSLLDECALDDLIAELQDEYEEEQE